MRGPYGSGLDFGELACHLHCKEPGTQNAPIFVDSSWIESREGPGGESRAFHQWNVIEALREGDYQTETGVAWDHHLAQNALGLQSVLYTYRMAKESPEGKSEAFDSH